ncbi:MAG TPA: S41 family peptidase [Patescibacteria group bacterium]|nr:S41 family peptidase [Patescibacteria group bacterium]
MYIGRSAASGKGGKKPWWVTAGKISVVVVIGAALFSLGFGFGNGTFRFGSANGQNAGLPKRLDYSSVDEVYKTLKTNYDGKLNQTQLLDGIKKGMAESTGDPYTAYFNAKEAKDFNDQLQGTFSGIGAELGKDSQGNLVVVSPIDGFPASKAGLRAQDVIVSIDGTTTSGMSVDDAVNKIRGKKGTDVTLRVARNKTDDLTFKITRDDIKIASVKWQILDGNIGYMKINQFSDDTASLAQQAAQEFKDKNVKGVILDLRGNPGGLVDACVSVASLWLPEGKTILQERRGTVAVSTELANGNNLLNGVKTAVLVDGGSASASEITAGALRDNNAATIIGVKTYGKGVVQQVIPLSGGSELKVTVASWYRPNGQNINKKGISPDQEVKMTDDDYKQGNDPQKDAAIQFLNKN